MFSFLCCSKLDSVRPGNSKAICPVRAGLSAGLHIGRSLSWRSSPHQGHCVVFLGKTLNSHGASLHQGEKLDRMLGVLYLLEWYSVPRDPRRVAIRRWQAGVKRRGLFTSLLCVFRDVNDRLDFNVNCQHQYLKIMFRMQRLQTSY